MCERAAARVKPMSVLKYWHVQANAEAILRVVSAENLHVGACLYFTGAMSEMQTAARQRCQGSKPERLPLP